MDERSEGLSEIDRALMRALDVDVSPGFAVGVRQRIGAERGQSSFWRDWRVMMPAAAAALILVAVSVASLWMRQSVPARPLPSRSVSLRDWRPADARPVEATRAAADSQPFTRRRAVLAPVTRPGSEPEVLVPREEIEMYRRLVAAAQKVPSAVIVASPADIVAGGEIAEITIVPIQIAPIIAPPDGAEGVRR